MAEKIDRLISGFAPTLLDADKGNELITLINGLVSSEGKGVIRVDADTDGKLTVSLFGLEERTVVVQKEDNEPEEWIGLFRDPDTEEEE
jgi:CO dehydrogenase nickel-insertion accessory protein CooC1